MTEVCQIESTTGSLDEAKKLATALVERRLAACAQIVGPITSTFWWEGKVQSEEEFLLLFKVPLENARAATAAIEELHGYDVPEVLVFKAEEGSRPYLDWVRREASSGTT